MRIDRPESPDSTAGRLAAAWARFRHWFDEQGSPARAAALVGLLAVIVAIGVLATGDPTAPRTWLYPDHRFTAEEARRIARQLVQASISAQAVGSRVEVPADRVAEAYSVVEKAGLTPLSPREIKNQPPEFHLLLTPDQIAQMDLRKQERYLEENLRLIDPALSATVEIRREERRGLRRVGGARVTVELNLEGGRSIPPELAERVRNKVVAWLDPEQLKVIDVRGTVLFSPDDPSLGRRTLIQAREDALRAELLASLSWIEDVRVGVEIEPGDDRRPRQPPVAEPEPIIRPNGPIALAEPPPPAAEPPTTLPPTGKANVMVLVPSRYYQRVARGPSGDTDPSIETIQALLKQTEATILTIVARTIRADELGEVTVDRYFQPPPERSSPPSTTRYAALPRLPEWWPAAAGAGLLAGAVLILAAGRGLRHRGAESASRRATPSAPRRVRFDAGGVEDAGPSERARALIRQDPAVAAGVLRRWIGHGGTDA